VNTTAPSESEQPAQPSSDVSGNAPQTQPGSAPARSLSRRIAGRTTDLLGIAVVAAGVLSVSGRLAEWWSTDPADLTSPQRDAMSITGTQRLWGPGSATVRIESDGLPVDMERKLVRGTRDQMDQVLRARCRDCLSRQGTVPEGTALVPGAANSAVRSDMGRRLADTEARLLTLLKDETPIERNPGEWALYRIDRSDRLFPAGCLVGIAERSMEGGSTDGAEGTETAGAAVVCWGLAIPDAGDQWTTFFFSRTGAATGAVPPLNLPASLEITLSLNTGTGDGLCAFRSRPGERHSIEDVCRAIGSNLEQTGWRLTRNWTQFPEHRSARFEQTRGSGAGSAASVAVEVSIQETPDDDLTGLASIIVLPDGRDRSRSAPP